MGKHMILHSEADKLESWDERELTVFVSTDDGPVRLDGMVLEWATRVTSDIVHLNLAYSLPPPSILDEINGKRTVSVVYGREYDPGKVVMRLYRCRPDTVRLTSVIVGSCSVELIIPLNLVQFTQTSYNPLPVSYTV